MKYIFILISSLLLLHCAGPTLIRQGYSPNSGSSESCDLQIVKHKHYSGNKEPLGKLIVKDNGASRRCREGDIHNIIYEEGCGIGAKVAQLKNIIEPSFIGSSCFQTEVEFYDDDPQFFTQDKNQSIEFDTVSNSGLRIRPSIGFGGVFSGSQASEHGMEFYKIETGETVDSHVELVQFGIHVDYFLNQVFGVSLGFNYQPISVSPEGGGSKDNVSLYDKHIISIWPIFNLFTAESYFGKFNLFGLGSFSYVLLSLDQEYKDVLISDAGVIPFSGYAKGLGWGGGMGMEIIKSNGFLSGMQLMFDHDNVQFKEATESLDANSFKFQLFIGYKIP